MDILDIYVKKDTNNDIFMFGISQVSYLFKELKIK